MSQEQQMGQIKCKNNGNEWKKKIKLWKRIRFSPCLREFVTTNQCTVPLTDHLYSIMKHFCPAGSRLIQEDAVHPQNIMARDGLLNLKIY